MGSFIIEGGHRLQGEVIPQGAKNEALQILCAVMLTAEPVTIHNLPDIVDVNKLINLWGDLGVKTQLLGPGSWRFEADDVNLDHLKSDSFRTQGGAVRGSVMILVPCWAGLALAQSRVPGATKSPPYGHPLHRVPKPVRVQHDAATGFFNASAPGGLKGTYMLLTRPRSPELRTS